jgi:hypothetical protein
LFDPIVVKDGQGYRRLSDPAWTDEGDGGEVSSEIEDFLDQIVTPETGSRRWGRQFSNGDAVVM